MICHSENNLSCQKIIFHKKLRNPLSFLKIYLLYRMKRLQKDKEKFLWQTGKEGQDGWRSASDPEDEKRR